MKEQRAQSSEVQSGASEVLVGAAQPTQEDYDEARLSRAQAQWVFGDWDELAALNLNALANHPDRDRLALLAASACQQLAEHDRARKFTRLALGWGCSPRLVAQVLIAGVHNSLGCVSALKQDEGRTRQHFQAAVSTSDHREDSLASHARLVREMTRMDLLPQAAALLGEMKEQCEEHGQRLKHAAAHVKVLGMEVEWLRQRVANHQKKQNAERVAMASANSTPKQATSASPPITGKYYGLHGLDRKLEAYIDWDGGYYVELGANDGITQSNTAYLERERKWKGVLVEPILHKYLECKNSRSRENRIYCAACVSFDYSQPYVSLTYSNLMTTPEGLESDIGDPKGHATSGCIFLASGEEPVGVMAPARTLNAILVDAEAPELIDLLSLDVEGAEIEVLKGIDHSRFRFQYMVIESRSVEALISYLQGVNYFLLDKLSHHDYLFALKM